MASTTPLPWPFVLWLSFLVMIVTSLTSLILKNGSATFPSSVVLLHLLRQHHLPPQPSSPFSNVSPYGHCASSFSSPCVQSREAIFSQSGNTLRFSMCPLMKALTALHEPILTPATRTSTIDCNQALQQQDLLCGEIYSQNYSPSQRQRLHLLTAPKGMASAFQLQPQPWCSGDSDVFEQMNNPGLPDHCHLQVVPPLKAHFPALNAHFNAHSMVEKAQVPGSSFPSIQRKGTVHGVRYKNKAPMEAYWRTHFMIATLFIFKVCFPRLFFPVQGFCL